RCRQRLVDGRPAVDPRISPGHGTRVACKERREFGIEQLRVARPRSMMEQAGDNPDPVLFQPAEALVVPGEIELTRTFGRNRFPQDGVAHSPDPELRHRVDIAQPGGVPGLDDLVAEFVTDANQRTFDSAPKLEGRSVHSAATAVHCGSPRPILRDWRSFSSMRRKVASACPTIWSIL